MERLHPAIDSVEDRESAHEKGRAPVAALHVRFWAYGGEAGKLRDLVWSGDKPIADLARSVVQSGQGNVVAEYPSIVVANFADALQALATAKSLQQRILALHREPPDSPVVAAVVVNDQCATKTEDPQAALLVAEAVHEIEEMLAESNSAQILVSAGIHDVAKTIPGFDFSAQPVHDTSGSGAAETFYELLWTDESTYGHLRRSSSATEPQGSTPRRYAIQSELGRGCMGVVYKAYDEVIGRSVALKTIAVNRNFPNRNELIERLKQEAKAAGSLDHPNIITIYDVGQEEDFLYLSMQLVEGKTLMTMLAENELPSLATTLSYVDQICSAVGFAHQRGVIHRDLKPANFMLTDQGVIKVLDFGIAKVEDATLTQTGMIVGTPAYMAPEQAKAKKVDQRTDIFALGSVFYELFTREKAFKGDITTLLYKLIHEDPAPPSVINPALPIGVDAIIRKALAKDPADRFQTCEEMRDAFREQARLLQENLPAKAPVPIPAPAPAASVEDLLVEVRAKRSSRPLWIAVACLFLAITGLGGWVFYAKAATGAYPAVVARIVASLRGGKTQSAANPAPAPSSPVVASDVAQAVANASTGPAITTPATPTVDHSSEAGAENPAATLQHPSVEASATGAQGQKEADNSQPSQSAGSQSSAGDSERNPSEELNPFQPRKRDQKLAASDANSGPVQVEGFTRQDVPDLLRRADDAAGRGDYRLARYEYGIVLRLDRQNAAARAGMRRVTAAEEER